MSRLFAGTPWDRPPRCERCGLELERECQCPPEAPKREEAPRVPPEKQTARLRVEKRAKGKVVTVVRGLEGELKELTATLKSACGSGGTVRDQEIEIQGDHLARLETALGGMGYRVRRG